MKTMILSAAAFLLSGAPQAGASQPLYQQRSLDNEIARCVAEIGRLANYDGGVHVVHTVLDTEQASFLF